MEDEKRVRMVQIGSKQGREHSWAVVVSEREFQLTSFHFLFVYRRFQIELGQGEDQD